MLTVELEADPPFIIAEVAWCYGMSNMTIVKENKKFANYGSLEQVEFLEFLGRLADKRYPINGMPLETKIEELFKLLLPKLLSKQPIQVSNEIEHESESDDDY